MFNFSPSLTGRRRLAYPVWPSVPRKSKKANAQFDAGADTFSLVFVLAVCGGNKLSTPTILIAQMNFEIGDATKPTRIGWVDELAPINYNFQPKFNRTRLRVCGFSSDRIR